jgi:serine/threonine protein kinase
MEYCSGGTLSDYLTSQSQNKSNLETLPLAEVKKITAELVMILEALNVHGVCHRDIKPHNLVFDAEGHLKLVDFGIAKLFEKTEKNSSHFDRIKKVLMEYEKKSLTNQKLEQFDDNEGNTTDTEPKDLVGSELYAAPEMIINGYSDFETDYWAMGRNCLQQVS